MTVEINKTQTANNKIKVLKVGGALLQNDQGLADLMNAVKALNSQGEQIVIVHGGGCIVDEQLVANNLVTEKLDGLRITPKAHIPVIVGGLAGTANKLLQAAAIKTGMTAVGMCLADGNTLKAKIKSEKLGLVGEVSPNDASYVDFILSNGWLPIISSIAISDAGEQLNVNADQAASALTKLLSADLYLLSDVSGVLDGEGQLLTQLNKTQIDMLISTDIIQKGMKVKVEAALEVAQDLGQPVQVASWKDADKLASLSAGIHFGTQINP